MLLNLVVVVVAAVEEVSAVVDVTLPRCSECTATFDDGEQAAVAVDDDSKEAAVVGGKSCCRSKPSFVDSTLVILQPSWPRN